MTKLPNDDQRLVDFLRQHRADPTPPAPDLEEQLMQAIASNPASGTAKVSYIRQADKHRHRRWWVAPPAIAAGLLIAIAGSRLHQSPKPQVELASLEAFMENSWDGVVNKEAVDQDTEWLQL